jgi:hypothetical protein
MMHVHSDATPLFERFETHAIDPGSFGHREHVVCAYEMLRTHPFLEAVNRYAKAIESIANSAGAPDKFHLTVTLAFLSIIAERIHASESGDAAAFLEANPDLLSPDLLHDWYPKARLESELARTVFLLPGAE